MGFLIYNDPLTFDNEEVLRLVGEDVYDQMIHIDFDKQFKDGGAYKDGIYHGISYKYLFWTLVKNINFLTLVLENEVKFVRSDHVHNFEMDRAWTTTEVYAVTGGIAGAVCAFVVSIVAGSVLLVSATTSAVAGASASTVASNLNKQQKEQPNPIDFSETHANRFETRKRFQQTEQYRQAVSEINAENTHTNHFVAHEGDTVEHNALQAHLHHIAERQPGVYDRIVHLRGDRDYEGTYEYNSNDSMYDKEGCI